MSLIRKPSELTCVQGIRALIYGQPGIGKSTLALSAPNPVLLDFDGGVNRINGAHQVPTLQVTSWDEVLQVMRDGELNEFDSIVVDTAGKMLDFISEYVMRNEPKFRQRDGSLSLKGFGARKTAFINFNNTIINMHKNIVYVAHEKEDKDGDKRFIRPEVGSASNQGDLIKELDLVGYMRANGYNREICFSGTDQFYGKNACNFPHIMSVPVILDAQGMPTAKNDFLAKCFSAYNKYLTSQRQMRAEFDKLMARINAAIEKITTIEEANTLWGQFKSVKHIWNSKLSAKAALDEKCSSLGFVYNEMNDTYEQSAA